LDKWKDMMQKMMAIPEAERARIHASPDEKECRENPKINASQEAYMISFAG